MSGPKRKWTDDALVAAVASSTSMQQVLLQLGLCGRGGGCYYGVQRHMERLGVDTSHFRGQGWLKGKSASWSAVSLAEYIQRDWRKINTVILKRKLIKEGVKENKCAVCGQGPHWNGKKLKLQLDHVNGNRADNRLENLRIICPNCHSQTPTFCGRTKRPSDANPNWRRKPREHKRKVVRPTKDELAQMLMTMPMLRIGKQFGVSDNAIRKWAKCYGIKVGRVAELADASASRADGPKGS